MAKKNNPVFDNTAKVVLNKAVFRESKPCERALGGKANVIRAAQLGLQNSDLISLITAHLVLNQCTQKNESGEINKAYKDGLTDFIQFLAKCFKELEDKQPSVTKKA